MRMHPKPALRHTRHVEPFNVEVIFNPGNEHQPFQIRFTRQSDGATQLLTLTEPEALKVCMNLAASLRYRDRPIGDVAVAELSDFYADMLELTRNP